MDIESVLQAVGTILFLFIPVVTGGILHMVVVTRDWGRWLTRPICQRWFGENKTWRGVVFMPVLTVIGVWLAKWIEPWLESFLVYGLSGSSTIGLGVVLGGAYILGELPNSWFKRRIGIGAGVVPNRGRRFFIWLDQVDSAIFFGMVYVVVLRMSPTYYVGMIVLYPPVALVIKAGLFAAGLKRQKT